MTLPTGGRLGQADEKSDQGSLRRRLMRTLNRKKSLPEWQPIGYGPMRGVVPEPQPSLLRKSISSVSSSLRGRILSDASADDDSQSQQQSTIRKSFSSMSSSVRGLRSSVTSRLSRDVSWRPATIHSSSFPEAAFMGGFSPRPRYDSFGRLSHGSSGCSSIPQLPDLDEMISRSKTQRTSINSQSPNSLFSMSIFNSLDGPLATKVEDNITEEREEPIARHPTPVAGRLAIRIKRPGFLIPKRKAGLGTVRDTRPRVASDSGCSGCSDETEGNSTTKPETSKVPVKWLDLLLEMTVPMRESDFQLYRPASNANTDAERLRRLTRKVYVFVPDDNNHARPWPKISYPDLKTALVDLCTRFKPYYAPFASYASSIRTVQLFPTDFEMAKKNYGPDVVIFNLQDALDNWNAPSCALSLCEEETEVGESTPTEKTWTTITEVPSEAPRQCLPLHPYDLGLLDYEEESDSGLLEPETPTIVDGKLVKRPRNKPKTMAASIPTQIAETIQTAHIQRNPSPRHDLNPSTSASEKQPVHLHEAPRRHAHSHSHRHRHHQDLDDEEYEEELDDIDDMDDDEIPISVLRPRPRSRSFPPMPDLRFEQSYLHSIAKADTWWKVAWVTVRDQMMMPFAQGVLYNLAICGWHFWNKNAQLGGNSVGAHLRRWWYGVNNWPLPARARTRGKA
ncbi:hypothetical protein F4677DRAFT_445093 [Hypoxylon crocopeplum]|nr:hypothetical protein F4677DRAFT_445093 [Hypoxylon crocopeplum]